MGRPGEGRRHPGAYASAFKAKVGCVYAGGAPLMLLPMQPPTPPAPAPQLLLAEALGDDSAYRLRVAQFLRGWVTGKVRAWWQPPGSCACLCA